jgi:hypothetical protein
MPMRRIAANGRARREAMFRRRVSYICLAVALFAGASSTQAAERGPLDQKFQVSLGGFFMDYDTDVRLDGEGETGTDINWEDEFDFDDQDRFRVDGFWRFAEKHKVRFMYFENNRGNTTVLTRDIEFGDTTFPINLEVDSRLDTRIIEIAYEYAFLRRENWELAGSIGIHNIRVEAGLRGDLSTPGGGGSAEAEEVAEGDGPLPVLGVHYLWHMGNNFYFEGLAQFFFAEVDNYDGSLEDYKIGVTWFPWDNVGIGIAYNEFVTRLDIEKDSFSGRLKVGYGGPLVYITVGF